MPVQATLTIVSNSPVTGISDAFCINEGGQVGGQEEAVFPFVWTPTTPNGTTGVSQRLPLPPTGGGPGSGTVTDLNANGDAVGFAETVDAHGAPVTRAIFWAAGGASFADLGTLIPNLLAPGTFIGNSKAFAINDSNLIVGVSDTVRGVEHAFVFDPAVGVMRDLGSLLPFLMLPSTADPSRAFDVNNAGDVVGEAAAVDAVGNVVSRAFLLPAGSFTMRDLGTLLPDPNNPGQFLSDSTAFAINDAGILVGSADAGDPAQPQPSPAFFSSGATPTGMFPAIGSAVDVNASNTVVGSLGTPTTIGFRFDSTTGLQDLNSTFATLGLTILRAVGINTRGQIAATASRGGSLDAVLITP